MAYAPTKNPVIEALSRRLSVNEQILSYIQAGRATFTLRSVQTGVRYTFKITKPENFEKHWGGYFVALMSGPDNECSFQYLGMYYPKSEEKLTLTRSSRMSADSKPVAAIRYTLKRLHAEQPLPANLEFWHSGRCGRCGKRLTVPESIERGIGPECASKM